MLLEGVRDSGSVLAPGGELNVRQDEVAVLSARAECGLADVRERLLLARMRLRLGDLPAALVAILPLLARDPPHPGALFIRGILHLRMGVTGGVHDLLEASGRNPMFMGAAVARIEGWLATRGRRYDTPALRAELARLRGMHRAALAERRGLSAPVVLRPASLAPAELCLVRDALRPFASRFHVAWLAGRACDLLPAWRHHEILLEARPGLLWPPRGAAGRLRELRAAAAAALPELPEGTLSLRVFPLLSGGHFRRQMRIAAGRPLLLGDDAPAPAPARPAREPS